MLGELLFLLFLTQPDLLCSSVCFYLLPFFLLRSFTQVYFSTLGYGKNILNWRNAGTVGYVLMFLHQLCLKLPLCWITWTGTSHSRGFISLVRSFFHAFLSVFFFWQCNKIEWQTDVRTDGRTDRQTEIFAFRSPKKRYGHQKLTHVDRNVVSFSHHPTTKPRKQTNKWRRHILTLVPSFWIHYTFVAYYGRLMIPENEWVSERLKQYIDPSTTDCAFISNFNQSTNEPIYQPINSGT